MGTSLTDWGYNSPEWTLMTSASRRMLTYRTNSLQPIEFATREGEALSFVYKLADLGEREAFKTYDLDIQAKLDVVTSGPRQVVLTLTLNDRAWTLLVPGSYIEGAVGISTPMKLFDKLLEVLRSLKKEGQKPETIPTISVDFRPNDFRGPSDPNKTTMSVSGEITAEINKKIVDILSTDASLVYPQEYTDIMSYSPYDSYLRYPSNPQDLAIERIRMSQSDVVKRTDEQTKRINEQQATIDRLSKQQEEILSLLRQFNEKKSKAKADDDEDEQGNPFASPFNDGKGQMEMLLRGLMTPRVCLDQVIMPDDLRAKILAVVNQQHNANTLFEQWGFAETLEKGKGMTLLFAGVPGTGKTMTAEAIAKHMGYDFWNIKSGNLDGMFVGDFEKAVTYTFKRAREAPKRYAEWEEGLRTFLRTEVVWNANDKITGRKRDRDKLILTDGDTTIYSIYQAKCKVNGRTWESWEEEFIPQYVAEAGPRPPKGIVLMFDEADSIVTARDNKEAGVALGPIKVGQINHILGELEEFDGVVIFATNRVVTLDEALQSRISLIAEFPFPDQQMREQIWRRLIPAKAPLAPDVDLSALAKHEIAGRHIKNAVLNAARTAAQEQAAAITQAHLLSAVRDQLHGGEVFHGKRPKIDVRAIYGDNDMMARIFTGHDNSLWN